MASPALETIARMAEGDPLKKAPYEKRWIIVRESTSSFDGKNTRRTKPWLGSIGEQVAVLDIRADHTSLVSRLPRWRGLPWSGGTKSSPTGTPLSQLRRYRSQISPLPCLATLRLLRTWTPRLNVADELERSGGPVAGRAAVYPDRFGGAATCRPAYPEQAAEARAAESSGWCSDGWPLPDAAKGAVKCLLCVVHRTAEGPTAGQRLGHRFRQLNNGNAGPSRLGGSGPAAGINKPVVAGGSGSTSFQGECNRCDKRAHKRTVLKLPSQKPDLVRCQMGSRSGLLGISGEYSLACNFAGLARLFGLHLRASLLMLDRRTSLEGCVT